MKVLGLTKEVGFVRGQQIDGRLDFLRLVATHQELEIVAVTFDLTDMQSLGQAAADERLLRTRQCDTRGLENEALKLTKLGIGERRHLHRDIRG